MSDHEPHGVDHGTHYDDEPIVPAGGGRRRARRRSGCLPILLVLALVAAGGYFLVRSIDIGNPFSSSPDSEDFPGPGQGSVVFTVAGGDTISTMARNLEDLGVVASAQAYVDAAAADPASRGIREGVYELKEEMKAADVVDVLVAAETKGTSFTFTSGKTVEEVVTLLAKDTGIGRKKYEAALADPDAIGLPSDAPDAEGYLAPGSYTFFDDDDATTILATMVSRTLESLEEADFAGAAERLGYTEYEILTIASLVEAEGSLLDEKGKSKIARVVYNRLDNPTAGTVGLLQIDATIDFIYGEKVARRTTEDIEAVADDPYNTDTQAGLPPGPIATPSKAALEAAANPADGGWFYYVTVNLRTGQTKFAETFEEFTVFKNELDEYCATQSDRC